ncbi:MAG TPA: hypothetical protein VMU39_15725 [Solirubrobacteraceae bacterium]|nr:hypothetical protein [Solirubrobacteraceae bacterium]
MRPESGTSAGHRAGTAGRRRTVSALSVAAVVLAAVALTLSYLGRAVLRPGPFADRAVAALRDPAVQADVADRLTAAVTQAGGGDLVAIRPVVRSVAGGVVASNAFTSLFRRAILEAHKTVVEGNGAGIVVTVADLGVLVRGVLDRFAPAVGRRIPTDRAARLVSVRPGGGVIDLVRLAKHLYSLSWVLALLALAAAVIAVLLSRDRWHVIRRLGIGLVAGGLTIAVIVTLGRAVVEQAAPDGRAAAAGALWTAFLGGLRVQALLLAAAGAICAGAASGQLRQAGVEVRRAVRWIRSEHGAGGPNLAGSFVLIAVGAFLLLEPGAALAVAVSALGLYVLYWGVAGGLSAAANELPKIAGGAGRALARARPLAPAALVVGAIVVLVAVLGEGGGDEAPAATRMTCNGYAALCNRELNDVALAATHNSMASVTIPNWLFGQQDGTIADQLSYGIRGLLIDTYYGSAVGGRVRTELESLPKLKQAERELGTPAVQAALRIRSRLGSGTGGTRGIFLCHGFCELGAVPLQSALADLRGFLVANPDDVVVVINQDEGVAPSDIERAFERAGLREFVYRGPLGPFPTLRSMIDSGQRLVVMAENDAGSIPWYHLAYARALQETPFRFRTAALLTEPSNLPASCRANRGPSSAPLFLLNHWVDTTPAPRPSLAAIVNARAVLLERARTCRRIRGHLPNLVAVDFYRRGDLLGVVDTLNGGGG